MFRQPITNAIRIVAVGVGLVTLSTATFAGPAARDGGGRRHKGRDITSISVLPGASITRGQLDPTLDAGLASALTNTSTSATVARPAMSLRNPFLGRRAATSPGSKWEADGAIEADYGASFSPTVQSAPAGRLPNILGRASFTITRDGESGLETSGAWTFEF